MADLFDALDDPRRERLLRREWAETTLWGGPAWLDPDGNAYTIEEAMAQLERLEREEQKP